MKTADCRFCLETDNIKNLIAPCSCKGTFKYVHNKCLMNWYYHQPERALHCSACLDVYQRRDSVKVEDISPFSYFMNLKLKSPFTIIIATQCTLFTIIYSEMTPWKPLHLYSLYQILNHICHFYYLSSVVRKIKNKKLYNQQWVSISRIILMMLHSYLLFTLPSTAWIGGIASEYCLCIYFYEHLHIINEINNKHTFYFVSRRTIRE
jgi:hypothetical protein